MTSKFTVSGTKTTITFEWTAPTTVIQSVLGDCAEYLCRLEEIHFASLSNNQKLTIIENHLKYVILDISNTFKSQRAQEIARAAEELTKYKL